MSDRIVVERMRVEHLEDVAKLAASQEARWHALDGRLRAPRGDEDLARELQPLLVDPDLLAPVAVDDLTGHVLGCAVVGIRELPPDSEALSFLGSRDGVVRWLTLPGPDDSQNEIVAEALLGRIETWSGDRGATGANLQRPLCDGWLWPMVERRGWSWQMVMALRPAGPLPASSRPAPDGLVFRQAQPQDEEAVVTLHVEEYAFHKAYDAAMRVVPGIELGMREILRKIRERQEGHAESDERDFKVFVVESGGEPVAMSIAYLYVVKEDSPGFIKEGKYCHIGSTGVRADMRGKGVGRALVEGITKFYDALGVQAYSLWYHTGNPLSSTIWPRLGWVPAAGRYVRRTED